MTVDESGAAFDGLDGLAFAIFSCAKMRQIQPLMGYNHRRNLVHILPQRCIDFSWLKESLIVEAHRTVCDVLAGNKNMVALLSVLMFYCNQIAIRNSFRTELRLRGTQDRNPP